MSGTKILKCYCQHEYQDEKYGKNNRVHTVGEKFNKCTVCNSAKGQ